MPSDWLLRNSCHSVIKSEVKPKPVTHDWCSYIFLSVTYGVFKNACILIVSQHYLKTLSRCKTIILVFGLHPRVGVGGATPIWKRKGLLVVKFELNSNRRPIWVWLGFIWPQKDNTYSRIGLIIRLCSRKESMLVDWAWETSRNPG